jgi:nucleotide-binding universal stress UspA family protein
MTVAPAQISGLTDSNDQRWHGAIRRHAMYQHILVAIDGTEAGAPALQAAVALAREQGAQLRLVHVVDEAANFAIDQPAVDIAGLDDAWRAAGQQVLDAATTEACATGITVETALLQRDRRECAEAIVGEAEQWGADLIVIGTHGRQGIRRLVLGSVAEGVARRSPIPVLLVRGRYATNPVP